MYSTPLSPISVEQKAENIARFLFRRSHKWTDEDFGRIQEWAENGGLKLPHIKPNNLLPFEFLALIRRDLRRLIDYQKIGC